MQQYDIYKNMQEIELEWVQSSEYSFKTQMALFLSNINTNASISSNYFIYSWMVIYTDKMSRTVQTYF